MVKSRRKGYDVKASAGDVDAGLFADDVVRLLSKKGFCIIDDGGQYDSEAKLAELREGFEKIQEQVSPTPTMIQGGLLGEEGSHKVAKLEGFACPEIIDTIDESLGQYASLIAQQTESILGFEIANRTTGILMESGKALTSKSEPGTDFKSTVEAYDWLQWFEWHRLMVLFIGGPDKATLELKPFDEDAEEMSVNVEPGMWIILRCDAMSHNLKPQGQKVWSIGTFILENNFEGPNARITPPFAKTPTALALDRFLIDALRKAKESSADEQIMEEALGGSRELQIQANRIFIRGDHIAVRAMATRLPGCGPAHNVYMPLVVGNDMVEDIRPTRWDHDAYFWPVPDECLEKKRTYARHCSWADGLEMFDNKFFGISPNEAAAMDPHQKLILEVGYECWKAAGYSKKTLMRSRFGVFCGSCANEWSLVPCDLGAFGGTTSSLAINANRMSFQLGLMGPSFSIELEGAASMIAVVQNADACQPGKEQQEAGISIGSDLALAPQSMCLYSWAGWNSVRGRCATFDESADGHSRSEGVACMIQDNLMTVIDGKSVISQENQIVGVLSSSRSGACGKTATYGAPNGIAEQELLAMTIRGADVNPLDVDAVECNGLGAILHDAVEVGSISKCYRSTTTQEMLGLSAFKANHGHGMRLAGITSCMKVMGCIQMGVQVPHIHLWKLNPHIELEDDSPLFVTTEMVPNRMLSSFVGATAKGYNGAIAHCIFYGDQKLCTPPDRKQAPPSDDISYWPGGGGIMKAELRPNRAYTIVGSWNHWEPEAMEQQGRGVYQKKVVLSDRGFERFQIWLDGNKAKTLYPESAYGMKDAVVHGPSPESETFGKCWQIDGRYKMITVPYLEEDDGTTTDQIVPTDYGPVKAYKVPSNDQAEPGDVFEVKLEVIGKYRTVTWEKVVEEVSDTEVKARKEPVPKSTYSVAGTFNKWKLEELKPDPEVPNLYHADVLLKSKGAEFTILVNGDLRMAYYPSIDGVVQGPDEFGIGQNFFINGKAGDKFKLSLQHAMKDDIPTIIVYWDFIEHQQGVVEESKGYFVIGDWDNFAQPIPMTFKSDPPRYTFRRPYPDAGSESFQLLKGGERRYQVYPNMPDANPYTSHSLKGPNDGGVGTCWTIGKHENDKTLAGEDYEVTLMVRASNDFPQKLSWGKVQVELE